ncbi:MAG: AsmA family protein [Alphaproteobacteria bacterium]
MKKFLFVFAAVLVLLVGAALVAPSFIDWTRYRDTIAAEIERAAGRKVVIAGTVEASLLPTPRLLLNDARFGNIPGASSPEMARLRSLEARVALLPLFSGQIVVESFVLREPVVTLEVLADGRRNWVFDADPAAAQASLWDDQPFVAPESVQLQNASITNGTVIYRNALNGDEERFENVNARVVADSLAGPLRAAGEARVGGKPARFTLAAGRFDFRHATATPLNATVDLMGPGGNTLRGALAFNGTAQFAPGLKLSGKARLGGADFAAALASFGPTGELPGLLGQPFSLEGKLTTDGDKADIEGLVAQLGEVRSQGKAALTFVGPRDGKPQLDLALTFGYIDLDAWLDMPPRAGEARKGGGLLPAGIRLSLETSAEAINYRKGLFRQIKASAELADGAATLRQLTLQAPGGTDATLDGRLVAEANMPPRFDGRIDMASDDFRNLLGWAGVNAKSLPAGRLNKLTATGRIGLGVETLELSDLDLRFDSTKLTGGIVAALRARPAFGANLAVDQINFDAYLPDGAAGGLPLTAETGASFDANILLRAGQFVWRQVPLRDLALDGTLDAGNLTLRKLAAGVGSGAGDGTFSLTGEVKAIAAKPAVALDIAAEAKDPAALYRLAGIEMPPVLPGGLKLAARVESDAKGYRFPKIDASLGGNAIAGAAALALDGARPKLSGKLSLGAIDTAALFGVDGRPNAPWSDAPLALYLFGFADAELDLAAKTLTHKTWRVADAGARVTAANGALAVEGLSGKLLGGDLALSARLAPAESGAALEGSFALAGASVPQGLLASKSFDLAGGKLDLAMEFAARGASEAGLIAGLAGKGQYGLQGATLRGVDLAAAAKRMPAVVAPADVQAALRTALAGNGKLASLDGSFTLENGVAATDDLVMQIEGAKGEGEIRANLADWTIEGVIDFKLDGDAAAPPAQLRLVGPLGAASKSFDSAALQAHALERAAKIEAERQAKVEAERRAAAERAAQQRLQQQQQQSAPPTAPPPRPQAPAAAPSANGAPAPSGDSFINDVLQGLPAR